MSKIIPFRVSNFSELENTLKKFPKSFISVFTTQNGKSQDCNGNQNSFTVSCSDTPFHIYQELRKFYLERINPVEFKNLFYKTKVRNFSSQHVYDKAEDFIENGTIFFIREAQFPPIALRRPEKNLYFATTFNMVITRFFIKCHEYIVNLKGVNYQFIFENLEICDRCSLRLIQNMHLYIKSFSFYFIFYFKKNQASISYNHNYYISNIQIARKNCFKKILNVVVGSGHNKNFIDTDAILNKVDFTSYYESIIDKTYGDFIGTEYEDFENYIYRGNYENFYVLRAIHEKSPWLNEKETIDLDKLLILCNSYNYVFRETISYIKENISKYPDIDKCYFLLLSGLINLKKNKDKQLALNDFLMGLDIVKNLPKSLESIMEMAFFWKMPLIWSI